MEGMHNQNPPHSPPDSPRPPSPRQERREKTRRAFLEAAKEITRTEGIEALSTGRIAALTDLSGASLYNYFKNFNELACLCLEELCTETTAELGSRITGGTPRERVLSLARLVVGTYADNPRLYSPFLWGTLDFSWFRQRDGHPFVHPAYPLLLNELAPVSPIPSDPRLRIAADILTCLCHSKLHFHLSYGTPATRDELLAQVHEETLLVLEGLQGA